MKIWIDLTNSPHINFFKPFINKWKSDGHEILLTTRDLANTIDLIDQNGWQFIKVGGHAGKSKLRKLIHFPIRVGLLWNYLIKEKPDVGISHSSFYSPLVSKLLGIPSIYLNDNEHAKGNYLAFKYASINLLPEFLKKKAKSLSWNEKYDVEFYPGIKEGIYLSQMEEKSNSQDNHKSERIYVRLEPWTAEYYSGKSHFMDELLLELKEKYKIIILPRGQEQKEHYSGSKFSGIDVAEKPIPLGQILKNCKMFIGAGGSMTRELAFLGKPVLSVYQDELLEVDKYLIEHGFMYHATEPDVSKVKEVMSDYKERNDEQLFGKGSEAFNLICEKIKYLGSN